MDIHSSAYRKAFIQYLRRGTAIELTLKADIHPTERYIWRTREDEKVRASHAANDGRIFSWDDPPLTGNPGDEYGCRCWAEPYYEPGDPNNDLPIDSVYPELALLPIASLGRIWSWIRTLRDVDAKTLNTAQAKKLSRFDKKLPKDAQEIRILKGPNGQRVFRSDVPARNVPGSYARYEKVVDRYGNTMSYNKTTYAPDGSIVHIKPK